MTSRIAEDITSAIFRGLDRPEGPVALHEPRFSGLEAEYVSDCISSTFVSSIGAYVDRFEKELASYTGVTRAVALVNGTAALQVALLIGGVKPGHEVLVPSFTFVATANAPTYLGAIPHFVDSNETTLGMDPNALRQWLTFISEPISGAFRNRKSGRLIKAVVPVHTFGHPCDLDGLLAIAHDFRLSLIEDAAEALGSYYCGKHAGTFGMLGALSFNGNKIITTGGGGAILTNDNELADYAKHITTTAKIPHRWAYEHDQVGYNFRMPNLNASLGCAQLEKINEFINSKRRLTLAYKEAFSPIKDVKLMLEPNLCRSNYWLQTLILDNAIANQLDNVLAVTNNSGLMTRPAWKLIHKLAPFINCPRAPLPIAESLANRIVNIPSSAGLA